MSELDVIWDDDMACALACQGERKQVTWLPDKRTDAIEQFIWLI
jgi:hypothetical protein